MKERLLTYRYEFSKHSPVNPEMAEKYGVKMKQPGEVTLESEFEKIEKVRSNMFTSSERVPFILEHHVKLCEVFFLLLTIKQFGSTGTHFWKPLGSFSFSMFHLFCSLEYATSSRELPVFGKSH